MNYMELLDVNNGISDDVITAAEKEMKIKFPKEYRDFMLKYNGCEGEIGQLSYISMWKIEELAELNKSYSVEEFTPNFVYFGSNGGDMAYAFDFSAGKVSYIEFPFMSIDESDKEVLGATLDEFFMTLYKRR